MSSPVAARRGPEKYTAPDWKTGRAGAVETVGAMYIRSCLMSLTGKQLTCHRFRVTETAENNTENHEDKEIRLKNWSSDDQNGRVPAKIHRLNLIRATRAKRPLPPARGRSRKAAGIQTGRGCFPSATSVTTGSFSPFPTSLYVSAGMGCT